MAVHVIYQDGFIESYYEGDLLWMRRDRGSDEDVNNPYDVTCDVDKHFFVAILGGGAMRVQHRGRSRVTNDQNLSASFREIEEELQSEGY